MSLLLKYCECCVPVWLCVLLSLSATRLFFAQHETALWSRHLSRNKNTDVFFLSGFTPEGADVSLGKRLCWRPLNQPHIFTTTLLPYWCKNHLKETRQVISWTEKDTQSSQCQTGDAVRRKALQSNAAVEKLLPV